MITNSEQNLEPRERERLRVLHDYGVLDSPNDPVFDDLTALAAKICRTPISLVSLVDENRQWFKSHHGLTLRETPRAVSFCTHMIRQPNDVLIIEDAARDERFAANPLVTGEPYIRFYAGAPLRTPEGHALGTLCVIDREPRQLTPDQLDALRMLARQAMNQLELRRTLKALQLSEQRFESVARAVSDVIWDWDLRTNTIWWSEGFEAVFGHRPEMVPGYPAWCRLLHPDDRDRVNQSIHRAIESGATTWRDEYRFRRYNGDYASVIDRGQILRDPNRAAYRMVGGMSDITELKQLEKQYLRAQRMESIGALASGIAHDLNNVLTPILMAIAILQERLAADSNALAVLHAIETSAVRGADLIRQVLSFARGVEGERRPTSVTQVLAEIVRLARGTFPRSIAVHSELPEDLWPVNGDATHLHQVFLNLFVNARDAMPEGGTLSISARNEHLRDGVCAPFKRKGGPYVITTVRDTGTGIPPEIIDRIFEPFFTTKPQGSGTGLGLSTVHGIVTSHGGFVRVTSTPGAGTTFEVCLPALPEARTTAGADATPETPTGQDELILVVDDEESIRSIAAQTLQSHGYRVLTAENGAAALTVFQSHAADVKLVVIDYMMPVMDGAACTVELLRLKPELPIITTSGGKQMPLTSANTEFVLTKPYTATALLAIVHRALESRKKQQ